MIRFLLSITVPFVVGIVAHIFGREATAKIQCTNRVRDITRYSIGAGLIQVLGLIFSPRERYIEHATSRLITTTSLGMGVIVGFFITGDDNA